jgi:signal recognition particle subunit SRP72
MSPTTTKSTARKHTKAPPRQPLPVPERLKRLFVSLCAQIDGGHFQNALKTCEKILAIDSQDRDALQAKLFLLLQTEQYNKALTLVDSLGDPSQYAYERAYIYYCLHRETDTEDVLKTLDREENKGVAHLEAQVNYRKGSYEAAFEMYNYLLDTSEPNTEEYSDIQNNLQASQKLLDFVSTGHLRALDKLPPSISKSLETSLPPQVPGLSTAPTAQAPAVSAKDGEVSKPKAARKSRVPTGVVPGVTPPPDPERWVKKSERTTFSTGKKRKAGGGGGGATQGSASVDTTGPPATPSKGAGGKGRKKK